MESRIDVVLTPENKESILQAIKIARSGMPFLIKLTDDDHKLLHKMDEGCTPFVMRCLEEAFKNDQLDPESELLKGVPNDIDVYSFLSLVEKQLRQFLEMVSDTKLLAGSEAFETATAIYSKAKVNAKLGNPGAQEIVDELGKLYKPTCAHTHLIAMH